MSYSKEENSKSRISFYTKTRGNCISKFCVMQIRVFIWVWDFLTSQIRDFNLFFYWWYYYWSLLRQPFGPDWSPLAGNKAPVFPRHEGGRGHMTEANTSRVVLPGLVSLQHRHKPGLMVVDCQELTWHIIMNMKRRNGAYAADCRTRLQRFILLVATVVQMKVRSWRTWFCQRRTE